MNIERRVFRFLLSLYPRDYRMRFAREMAELLELRLMATHNRARFLMSEAAGLSVGVAREWLARGQHPHCAPVNDPDMEHLPKNVMAARLRVNCAVQKMVSAISHREFERARRLALEERIEREKLRRLCEDYGIETT